MKYFKSVNCSDYSNYNSENRAFYSNNKKSFSKKKTSIEVIEINLIKEKVLR